MLRKSKQNNQKQISVEVKNIKWLKAGFKFHTYCYRDPRAVFATSVGVPVVSPTTVLLGIASTLFRLGYSIDAKDFLGKCNQFSVIVDAPAGVIFFRAFHQVRRYETSKFDDPAKNKFRKVGFTTINQATKEYGLVDGQMDIYVGITEETKDYVTLALTNLTHLGTHDSLCTLVGQVKELETEPENIIYTPSKEAENSVLSYVLIEQKPVTMVTLSKFNDKPITPTVKDYWWMAGGANTEFLTYLIPGKFEGTTRGKIYKKK